MGFGATWHERNGTWPAAFDAILRVVTSNTGDRHKLELGRLPTPLGHPPNPDRALQLRERRHAECGRRRVSPSLPGAAAANSS
jgi:hypothetical protein